MPGEGADCVEDVVGVTEDDTATADEARLVATTEGLAAADDARLLVDGLLAGFEDEATGDGEGEAARPPPGVPVA